MNHKLALLALVLATAAPAAFIIELAGTTLPSIVDAAHLTGAFMLTFLVKIIAADYARLGDSPLARSTAPIVGLPGAAGAKSNLRLAA